MRCAQLQYYRLTNSPSPPQPIHLLFPSLTHFDRPTVLIGQSVTNPTVLYSPYRTVTYKPNCPLLALPDSQLQTQLSSTRLTGQSITKPTVLYLPYRTVNYKPNCPLLALPDSHLQTQLSSTRLNGQSLTNPTVLYSPYRTVNYKPLLSSTCLTGQSVTNPTVLYSPYRTVSYKPSCPLLALPDSQLQTELSSTRPTVQSLTIQSQCTYTCKGCTKQAMVAECTVLLYICLKVLRNSTEKLIRVSAVRTRIPSLVACSPVTHRLALWLSVMFTFTKLTFLVSSAQCCTL